ncbi:MAG: response regulator [Anaerolineae bacterium]
MKKETLTVLVAARPGPMRNGLLTVIAAILPEAAHIHQTDNGPATLDFLKKEEPTVVFVDAALPECQLEEIVQQICSVRPNCKCVAMVTTSHDFFAADEAGADVVLLKGFSATVLRVTLEQILPDLSALPVRQIKRPSRQGAPASAKTRVVS